MCRVFFLAATLLSIGVAGCDKPLAVSETHSPAETESGEELSLSNASHCDDESLVSVLSQVKSFAETAMPPAEFAPGHAEPIESSELEVEPTNDGYIVTFPAGSPIPSPTIVGKRVFVSGGFSSESFHCLDLKSGQPIWEMRLDDDGPSSGVPSDDVIVFGTESCTVFALHQESGALEWSAFLGDPLLSAPAVADGHVITVYPATNDPPEAVAQLIETTTQNVLPSHKKPAQVPDSAGEPDNEPKHKTRIKDLLEPTHLAVCMDAKSGDVRWRTWIDSDCLTAPVIAGRDVYIASLAGTLYQLSMVDGSVRSARRAMATSAPLVIDDSIYITRRREESDGTVGEYLSFLRLETSKQYFAAASVNAVYLQAAVQMNSELQDSAVGFEQMNGFGGGGFGGGFGGSQGSIGGGGGSFQIPDDALEHSAHDQQQDTVADIEDSENENRQSIDYSVIGDLLGYTEVQAAENIGLGSASTIQGFAGSLTVADSRRLYNTMGDRLVCTSRRTGDVIWTVPIEGDLQQLGGHLASPPVLAGDRVFLATAEGKVLEVDPESGEAVTIKAFETAFRFRPVVTRTAIVVTSQDGRLFCLRRSAQ